MLHLKNKKHVWGFAALIGALLIVSTSVAVAQGTGGPPDGGAPSDRAAAQTPVTISCGANISSIVRTGNEPTDTSSTQFVTLTGAVTTVTVPSGTTRCIKVVFTAESACSETTHGDYCYVRAVRNGWEMHPSGNGFQTLSSESSTSKGNAFAWAVRAGPGRHTVSIEHRVGAAGTVFSIDDWTFDVQVTN